VPIFQADKSVATIKSPNRARSQFCRAANRQSLPAVWIMAFVAGCHSGLGEARTLAVVKTSVSSEVRTGLPLTLHLA
jgi:hypothetical protein